MDKRRRNYLSSSQLLTILRPPSLGILLHTKQIIDTHHRRRFPPAVSEPLRASFFIPVSDSLCHSWLPFIRAERVGEKTVSCTRVLRVQEEVLMFKRLHTWHSIYFLNLFLLESPCLLFLSPNINLSAFIITASSRTHSRIFSFVARANETRHFEWEL